MLGHSAISQSPISTLPSAVAAAVIRSIEILGMREDLEQMRPRWERQDLAVLDFMPAPRFFLRNYTAQGEGLHRVADDLNRYELFHTEGVTEPADPDIDGATFATFAVLPYTTVALNCPKIHRFILCKRNRYGLLSRNRTAWRVELDAAGAVVTPKPSAPAEITLTAAAGGTFKVTAQYAYLEDGVYAANQFLVYLKTGGADPDPALDTPTIVALSQIAGVASLEWSSSAFADGTVGKVLVRTRRTGTPNSDSANVAITGPVSASTTGPAAPTGGIFLGAVAEQKQ